jgi:hypothetical protein
LGKEASKIESLIFLDFSKISILSASLSARGVFTSVPSAYKTLLVFLRLILLLPFPVAASLASAF